MSQRISDLLSRLQAVRLVVTDVDGTLTDGGLYYDAAGSCLRRFDVHDGMGLVLVKKIGLRLAILSSRGGADIETRAKELGFDVVKTHVRDKAQGLEQICDELQIDLRNCLYIGDDVNDITAFNAAGIAIAVSHSPPSVSQSADFITRRAGGHGAIREICDMILEARGIVADDSVRFFQEV